MNAQVSRASLIRGDVFGRQDIIRPPWGIPENLFTEICTRCDECITACPEKVISAGPGGYPAVSFDDGECTFCGDCRQYCEPGALKAADAEAKPWRVLAIVDGSDCLGTQGVLCRLCDEQCEVRAISFPQVGLAGVPLIDTQLCTGCGACIGPCPTDAITARAQDRSNKSGEQAA